MTEKQQTKTAKCPSCGKSIEEQFGKNEQLYYFWCEDCQLGGKGKTGKEAANNFMRAQPAKEQQQESQQTHHETQRPQPEVPNLPEPKNKNEFFIWAPTKIQEFIDDSADFIDMPAKRKMIQKNLRYVEKANFKDVWKTPEGVSSIIDALYEAQAIGATLGLMGDIVPYGKTAEYIPSKEAYIHALTTGPDAPFVSIGIYDICENDSFNLSRDEKGNFNFSDHKIGFPRGAVVGIVVTATETKTGRVIGDAFDEKRLMDKARTHSISYRYYLTDMANLKKAQAEGKDYIVKWDKKLYAHDITNPYESADKTEMLKKVAAKTFFRPFMRVRDALAVVREEQEEKEKYDNMTEKQREKHYVKTAHNVVDESLELLKEDASKVKDAEFEMIENEKQSENNGEEKQTGKPEEKSEEKSENKNLFTEEI